MVAGSRTRQSQAALDDDASGCKKLPAAMDKRACSFPRVRVVKVSRCASPGTGLEAGSRQQLEAKVQVTNNSLKFACHAVPSRTAVAGLPPRPNPIFKAQPEKVSDNPISCRTRTGSQTPSQMPEIKNVNYKFRKAKHGVPAKQRQKWTVFPHPTQGGPSLAPLVCVHVPTDGDDDGESTS